MREIVHETMVDGHRVVEAKGYTNYTVAMSTAVICEAIAGDARTIPPVSTLIDGSLVVPDVCLTLTLRCGSRRCGEVHCGRSRCRRGGAAPSQRRSGVTGV
jgi:L-lactate dehydrogenase